MFRSIRGSLALVLACVVSVSVNTAWADWPNADVTKWVQLPDREDTGMDVAAVHPVTLADDFRCDLTGPISDIHVWGSYLNDVLPPNGPEDVLFKLSFHKDVPAGVDQEYSHPGELLWEMVFQPFDPNVRVVQDGKGVEQFYDPPTNEIVGSDTEIWQYNFFIPEDMRFIQEKGNIYWLDVEARFADPAFNVQFGWKTSNEHWNDDAVWLDSVAGAAATWRELRYPANHPLAHESIDLSFALTTVPEPSGLAILAMAGIAAWMLRR